MKGNISLHAGCFTLKLCVVAIAARITCLVKRPYAACAAQSCWHSSHVDRRPCLFVMQSCLWYCREDEEWAYIDAEVLTGGTTVYNNWGALEDTELDEIAI